MRQGKIDQEDPSLDQTGDSVQRGVIRHREAGHHHESDRYSWWST
jgi:hypothetical protein